MSTTPARQALRDLLDTGELIVAPGVFDGISAQLTSRTGHVAAYLTGAGVAASGFGLPDIGLVTADGDDRARPDDRRRTRRRPADRRRGHRVRTRRCTSCALFGCTTPPGVAAIQLEDQVFPKRCGHLPDKQVVDAATFEQTLAAALDARSDDNLLVVARTDARAPLGSRRRHRAGQPLRAKPARTSSSSRRRRASTRSSGIAREVDAPLLINLVLGGMTPLESASRLARTRLRDRDPSRRIR